MWVDHSPSSLFQDQIYVTWLNKIATPPSTTFHAFVARRTAGLGGAWQTPIQVSGAETTGVAFGGDIKTNSTGDVFVFWQDAGGTGKIYVAKSTDGGVSFKAFAAPVPIATVIASDRSFGGNANILIPAASHRGAHTYVSGGAFRDGTRDLVYAVWADLTDATLSCLAVRGPGAEVTSTCKCRIFFSRSTDGGKSWAAPQMLNNQPGLNDQFFARLAVDENNGSLAVIYYDTVEDPGRLKTNVWVQTSSDDGVTWSDAVKVTSAPTDETATDADRFQYGDYIGLTGHDGKFYPAWTDRRNGGAEEIWTAPFLYDRFPTEAPIAAISRSDGNMDIFSVAEYGQSDGPMISAWWDDNPWRRWFPLFGERFPHRSPIAVISRDEQQMDVFTIKDGQLLSCWFNASGGWRDWFRDQLKLPGTDQFPTPLCHVAALAHGNLDLRKGEKRRFKWGNYMDVFAVDNKRNVRGIWWHDGWNPWYNLLAPSPSKAQFEKGSMFAVNSRSENRMDLFIAGSDNQLWRRYYVDSWDTEPTALADNQWIRPFIDRTDRILKPSTPIAVIDRDDSHMDLFAISPFDGQLWWCYWDGTWHGWQVPKPKLGPCPTQFPMSTPFFPFFAHVAAVSRDPNYMDVFAVDLNGNVWGVYWEKGSWIGWFQLPGKLFPPGSPIAVNSRDDNQMDLFIVSGDRRIWSNWFTGGWNNWFRIFAVTD